ncbi:MAG: ATP-binding cassette domain-containing protein [Treponema sp.]|jgi:ATPase subunit of ABC transporter with duplicated ATPase domains|nr:ATP-binding cassette domain-containing protein [Treponema sp.]
MLFFHDVSFFYPSSVHPVLENISAEFHHGWTGVTGDNGAGKTTFLMLAAGLLEAQRGTVSGAGGLYCAQRTDNIPNLWEEFFSSPDSGTGRLMSLLGIEADWPYRWETLSHGERKRLQLGIALWREPELLALDEPTNHLDRDAKALVAAALASYSGVGLLVSHDRALLDGLCVNCLFLRQGKATLRPGGVSKGLAGEEREFLELKRLRKNLSGERERLAAETEARRRVVEGSKNRLSKKNLDPKDGDRRGKINLARLSGKDRNGADLYKRMEKRLGRLDANLASVSTAGRRKLGIRMETSRSRMDRLCVVPPGLIPLGEERGLVVPELVIHPEDRIALTGPNGAGKSTLLGRVVSLLPPALPVLYVPQEISAEEARTALAELEQEPEKNRGEIFSRFSRLGSDPALLLQSRLPSPGEIRKLLIARSIFLSPVLIIMDEPTNHMDLNSVRLLEEMLAELDCALLLASHDEVFLSALSVTEWTIEGPTRSPTFRLSVNCRNCPRDKRRR